MEETATACEFKTAEELGLSEQEYTGLVRTLVLMEAGAIRDVVDWADRGGKRGSHKAPLFDMGTWHNDNRHCGTVCCIGGTAELLADMPIGSMSCTASTLFRAASGDLYKLFFEFPSGVGVKQCSRVLRGYLTTGVTNWNL